MQDHIKGAIEAMTVADSLSCADAHAIAQKLGQSPLQLGRFINDQTAVRIYRCQLGLFGYGPKAEHKSKIVLPATNIPDEIAAALHDATVQGRIPCHIVWEIAERFAYPRLGIANILEALGIRVASCQLGCF